MSTPSPWTKTGGSYCNTINWICNCHVPYQIYTCHLTLAQCLKLPHSICNVTACSTCGRLLINCQDCNCHVVMRWQVVLPGTATRPEHNKCVTSYLAAGWLHANFYLKLCTSFHRAGESVVLIQSFGDPATKIRIDSWDRKFWTNIETPSAKTSFTGFMQDFPAMDDDDTSAGLI